VAGVLIVRHGAGNVTSKNVTSYNGLIMGAWNFKPDTLNRLIIAIATLGGVSRRLVGAYRPSSGCVARRSCRCKQEYGMQESKNIRARIRRIRK